MVPALSSANRIFLVLFSVVFFVPTTIKAYASEHGRLLAGYYVHAFDDAGAFYLTEKGCKLPAVNPKIKECINKDLVNALYNPQTMGLIDGISFDYDWADVEPQPGVFDFSYFSDQLEALAQINTKTGQHHKAILAVVPSTFPNHPAWYNPLVGPAQLPPWLFEQEKAQPFQTMSSGYVMINSCLPMTIPVPWDPVFQRQYKALINAFGQYVAREPNRDLIAAVKLIGFVYLDEISHLPPGLPTRPGIPCTNRRVTGDAEHAYPDDMRRWKDLGYTERVALNAFRSIVTAYKQAFPDIPLELTVQTHVLPPLDEEGQLITVGREQNERPNIYSTMASSRPVIAAAQEIVGPTLLISDHALSNVKPAANLFTYNDAGQGGYDNVVGYGNGWLVSNDQNCQTTGGWRTGSPPNCTDAWAMAENLDEAELSGASYLVLDLPDIVFPAYHNVLQHAHNFLLAHPGGSPHLVSTDQQDMSYDKWEFHNVAVSQAPRNLAIPPIELNRNGREEPKTMIWAETDRSGAHGASTALPIRTAGDYAFSIYAGLPRRVPYERWIKVTVKSGARQEAFGVFDIHRGVIESYPVSYNFSIKAGPPPGAAQMSNFTSDNFWTQLVVRFRMSEAGVTQITIQFVKPEGGPENDRPLEWNYVGSRSHSFAFWGPQVVMLSE